MRLQSYEKKTYYNTVPLKKCDRMMILEPQDGNRGQFNKQKSIRCPLADTKREAES